MNFLGKRIDDIHFVDIAETYFESFSGPVDDMFMKRDGFIPVNGYAFDLDYNTLT